MSSTVLGSGDIVAERYRIDGLLGQGGMGSVYRAVQLSMGRSVALKLLATEQPATREQVERFEREAQALAKLQHPSTVRLFDFGSVEPGRPFIVMELLGGSDLEQDLAHNGPMRWDRALRVCQQVLGSLGEAHALGIIHRDVKPANVYLCAGAAWPAVKLLDFGIAGCVELASTRKLTATGTVLGSAPYMSPEQAQGHPVGPAADLYALGVVLFEMLTGQTPFAGRGFTAQLVAKVLEPAPPVLDACPGLALPAGLCELVGRLLERDASRRPACAQDVSERLSALLDDPAVQAMPPLRRPLPSRELQTLAAKTEPMLVPLTVADGWVPPSAPMPSSTMPPSTLLAPAVPRRSGRTAAMVLPLAVPALALAWWVRDLREPSAAVTERAPLAALAPSRGSAQPAGQIAVQVAGAASPSALGDDLGDAIAELPDAGAADAGHSVVPAEPAPAVERQTPGDSRPRQVSDGLVASREVPKAGRSAVKPSGRERGGERERPNPAPPKASAGAQSPANFGVGARQPEVTDTAGVPEPSPSGAAAASSESASGSPSASSPSVASGTLPGAPPAAPPGALPGNTAASASLPSGSEVAPTGASPRETLPTPAPPGPPLWVEPPPPLYTPAPSAGPDAHRAPEPVPVRSPRWLLRRYPTVASASEAARAGEITPSERNIIVAELRRARQDERGRAIRKYRAGYIDRGELRARLREIDRRYEGAFEQYPRSGIHIWP